MTERTENIIGAFIAGILISLVVILIGWAVPNYYVYFKNTVAQAGPDCDAVQSYGPPKG